MQIAEPVRGTVKIRFLVDWTEKYPGDPWKKSLFVASGVVLDVERSWAETLVGLGVAEVAS